MFESIFRWLETMGASSNDPIVLLILLGASALEYILPPFPGDSVILVGGFLVGAYDWNFWLVWGVVMFGSVMGSLLCYGLGWNWYRVRSQRLSTHEDRLSMIAATFARRGSWYIMLNRFIPGVRPLFFVAAGLAKLPFWRVAVLGTISSALWSVALMAAGVAAGNNIEKLEDWLDTYNAVVWIVIFVVVAAFFLRYLMVGSRQGQR